jgi:uncharacterized repeat protein (TIGR02543 family)
MNKKTFNKVGVLFFALAFSALPALKVSAATEETSGELWLTPNDRTNIYCDEGAAVIFTAICSGQTTPSGLTASGERYIDITMHAGEYGHFEGDVDELVVTYYRSDNFADTTEPIADNSNYVFAGWSTHPEATTVDIEVNMTKAYQVGTDLYAVWSNKAYVMYNVNNGAWHSPDGDVYQTVLMEYNAGDYFQPLSPAPQPYEQFYDFVGWSEGASYDSSVPYTSDTVIDKFWTEVYADWDYNASRMENELIVDQVYDVQSGVSVPAYKFTPTESGWYEIYTDGIEDDGTDRQGMIRLRDIHDRSLKMEQLIDPAATDGEYDVHLYYEMEAGETYYVRFGEMSGMFLAFDAGVRKAETVTVTFDSNHGAGAWFEVDGDQSATVDVEIPVGDDIATLRFGDGNPTLVIDDDTISFNAWAEEPDPDETHNHLIVTGPMTVYADYMELVAIYLDYNGGYNPFKVEETSYVAKFRRWDKFVTPIDPKNDNPRLKFAGWSTDPDATEPEAAYRDSQSESAASIAENLNGDPLYAVYTEPVTVIFNTIGGAYMMDDPSATSYESSYGNGHVFYGMAVMHDDPQVVAQGWVDQNGVFVPVVSEEYGAYILEEDTTFTSVLGYKAMAYGNGGCFPYGGIGCYNVELVALKYEGPDTRFSYEDAFSKLGTPVYPDSSKKFIGFATNPDATEPDIIDGETYVDSIYDIYAIWGDNEEEEDSEEEDEALPVPDTGVKTDVGSVAMESSAISYDGLFAAVGISVSFGLFMIYKAERW